jgi:hypothetical protein
MRVLRLATKTAMAQHHGTDVLALLTVIACQEDARRYRGPVAFFNAQLLPLLGFRKWERLDRARRAAIESGWLLYESQGSRRPGLYRTTIPPDADSLADSAVDEGLTPEPYPSDGDDPNGSSPSPSPPSSPGNGYVEGYVEGEPSVPIPLIPNPMPLKTSATVSAGEIRPAKASKARDAGNVQEPIPIPAELDTPAFREAWLQFVAMRKEIGKPLKPTGAKATLTKLQRWGVAKAIEALENATAAQWQGLFEPDERKNRQRPAQQDDPRGNFAAGRRYLEMFGRTGQ